MYPYFKNMQKVQNWIFVFAFVNMTVAGVLAKLYHSFAAYVIIVISGGIMWLSQELFSEYEKIKQSSLVYPEYLPQEICTYLEAVYHMDYSQSVSIKNNGFLVEVKYYEGDFETVHDNIESILQNALFPSKKPISSYKEGSFTYYTTQGGAILNEYQYKWITRPHRDIEFLEDIKKICFFFIKAGDQQGRICRFYIGYRL